jgi:hypothetical protein
MSTKKHPFTLRAIGVACGTAVREGQLVAVAFVEPIPLPEDVRHLSVWIALGDWLRREVPSAPQLVLRITERHGILSVSAS